ncbi:MAG: hypothetical protein US86_C0001G0327 [Candidatus Daviesbacteria bacterium GW2011_GWA2_38_24]|uniref:YcfA family protein n=1 Tax=Candidatus Daviesbacteria bacterium GW2011_GWA2_38_24 TaxID=1618422 RepID=A0A0G0JWA3_9BACT|nr:MAG: hypothetical protein US86_C0001G0327 [Candidatus Daviesbacteria bacterium GW2011_GWA2_38_24]KKQ80199.1 MAG: hypothetical protein UT01_C0017G0012 [Candidatus Daviesbacteria bacterium GW2011_GWA1_38_7]OGE23699.1 MAG: hypothetical protein A2688_00990 [Candidatus Daviesbacteria bacterium RIFCSPHIGHO2_01_FULL_38_8]
MPKLSPINATKLIEILSKQGFVKIRQNGSHVRLEHPDGRQTSVPVHSGENVRVGLLRKILRDVNISRDEFEKQK